MQYSVLKFYCIFWHFTIKKNIKKKLNPRWVAAISVLSLTFVKNIFKKIVIPTSDVIFSTQLFPGCYDSLTYWHTDWTFKQPYVSREKSPSHWRDVRCPLRMRHLGMRLPRETRVNRYQSKMLFNADV